MNWYFDEIGNFVRLKKDSRILANVAMAKTYEEQLRNGRLMAAAPEMYEMITKLVDAITIVELLNRMQGVKVNPVLIESAKRLLAEIDGKKNEEAEHDCY